MMIVKLKQMKSINKKSLFKIPAIDFKKGEKPETKTLKLDLDLVLNLEASPIEVTFNFERENKFLVHLGSGFYMNGTIRLFTRNADKFLDDLFKSIPSWWKIDNKNTRSPVCLKPKYYGLDPNRLKKFDLHGKVQTVKQANSAS